MTEADAATRRNEWSLPSAPVAISCCGIGKRYSLGEVHTSGRTLKGYLGETISGRRRAHTEVLAAPRGEFWALRDVSFRITSGEAVAIVGRNGSGKSTLLKVLARATFPTEGEAEIYGRVAPLLAMGAGFNPEFNGRDNIALSGVMLGLSTREVRSRVDQIVEFADIGRFIDTPVKHYSSGMYIRLAFSIAVHVDAEVLLADEVLAVGDAEFQEKCMERMANLVRSGSTLLFVSHNESAVRKLCPRTLYLTDGLLRIDGPTEEVLAMYHEDLAAKESDRQR